MVMILKSTFNGDFAFLYLLFKIVKEFSERHSTFSLFSFHDGDKSNAE